MKKTFKNIELVQIINGIHEMKESEKKAGEAKLSLPVNFALSKNLKALMAEAQTYEDCRQEIVNRYNNPRSTDQIDILPENVKKYNVEMEQLLQLSVEVEIREVSYEQLEACKNLLISELELLDFMIKE